MKRRSFLAGFLCMGALAGTRLRMPEFVPSETEHPDGIALYSRELPLSNSLAEAVDLSEESIEDMCIEIRKLTDDRGILRSPSAPHAAS
jgi:hypothetical protein